MNARHIVSSSNKGKPFLRLAGGKRWLIKQLDEFLPETLNVSNRGTYAFIMLLGSIHTYLFEINILKLCYNTQNNTDYFP